MAKKKLNQCNTGKELIRYIEREGKNRYGTDFHKRNGKGCHILYKTPKGAIIVSPHSKGKGIMSKLIKTAILIGLGVMILYFI